jgi:FkbM family methyltransferase
MASHRELSYAINLLRLRPSSLDDLLHLHRALYKTMLIKLAFSKKVMVETYIRKPIVIKHWIGSYFLVRPGTSDIYDLVLGELYELKRWFLPRARGVVVDVGAYIGKYTVFACVKDDVERVIAIEPVPWNSLILKTNVKINQCEYKVNVIDEAIASVQRELTVYIPYDGKTLSFGGATLKPDGDSVYREIDVRAEPLDDITQRLGIERVDFLKIDVEGYVSEAFPGMIETMRRTRFLMIELWRRDLLTIKKIKQLGFKLVDRRGDNYLFQRFI